MRLVSHAGLGNLGSNVFEFLAGFMLCLLCSSGANASASGATASERRPNFLFVLVDDQSPFDLKVYNPIPFWTHPCWIS